MAYFNLLRIGFGAGVLGIPLAISQAGIILGPLLAMFTGFLLVHTHLILVPTYRPTLFCGHVNLENDNFVSHLFSLDA